MYQNSIENKKSKERKNKYKFINIIKKERKEKKINLHKNVESLMKECERL